MWRGCLAGVIFESLYLERNTCLRPLCAKWISLLNATTCFRFLCMCDQIRLLRCFVFCLIYIGNILIKMCFVCVFVYLTCQLFCKSVFMVIWIILSACPFQYWHPAGTKFQWIPAPSLAMVSQSQLAGFYLAVKATVLELLVSWLPLSEAITPGLPQMALYLLY